MNWIQVLLILCNDIGFDAEQVMSMSNEYATHLAIEWAEVNIRQPNGEPY